MNKIKDFFKRQSLSVLIAVFGLVLLGGAVTFAQVNSAVGGQSLFRLLNGAVTPTISTWTLGSPSSPISHGYFTNLTASTTVTDTLTFSGVGGDIDFEGFQITNAGLITGTHFMATSTTATSTFAGAIDVSSGALFVDPSLNRVGFNNNAPATTMHIGNDSSATLQGMYFTNTQGTTRMGIAGGGSDIISSTVAGDFALANTNATGDMIFGTGGSATENERMRIQADGTIGIGTNSPSEKLEINGNFEFSGDGYIKRAGTELLYFTSGAVQTSQDLYGTADLNTDLGLITRRWKTLYSATLTDTGSKVGIATTSPTATLTVNGNIVSESNALTDGATIDIDWAQSNVHYVTLGDNRTITFSNVQIGQSIRVYVTQDGTGSRTLTYPTIVWKDATAPTLTTTAGATDILVFTTATSTGTVFGSYSTGY